MEDTKSTIEDFGSKTLGGRNSTPRAVGAESEKTDDYVKQNTSFIQYSRMGDNYIPCGRTSKILKSGSYKISRTDTGLPIFEPSPIKSDAWLTFRDSLITDVTSEIKTFWNSRQNFIDYGFMQRRGYIFYGPMGSGKSVLLKQLIHSLIEMGGIVFICDNSPDTVQNGLKFFSQIEPNRNIICIFEDIDAIIDRYGESDILSLLDGEDSVDNVLNLATTNYPEKLDRRIIARPRRFDRVIKIGYPEREMRQYYFEQKLNITKKEVTKWVDATENFTFAALSELVISVKCLGNDFDSSVKKLRDLLEIKVSSEDYKIGKRLGFGD